MEHLSALGSWWASLGVEAGVHRPASNSIVDVVWASSSTAKTRHAGVRRDTTSLDGPAASALQVGGHRRRIQGRLLGSGVRADSVGGIGGRGWWRAGRWEDWCVG